MLSNSGHVVTVWSVLPVEVKELSKTRIQINLLDMEIPTEVSFPKKLNDLPWKGYRFICCSLCVCSFNCQESILVCLRKPNHCRCSKENEPDTLVTMSEIIA